MVSERLSVERYAALHGADSGFCLNCVIVDFKSVVLNSFCSKSSVSGFIFEMYNGNAISGGSGWTRVPARDVVHTLRKTM